MYQQVVRLNITVVSLVIPYNITSVMVLVIAVFPHRLVCEKRGVEIWIVEINFVNMLRVVVHADYLKTAELIASFEDKMPVVLELHLARRYVRGSQCRCHHVLTSVLCGTDYNLTLRVIHGQPLVVYV